MAISYFALRQRPPKAFTYDPERIKALAETKMAFCDSLSPEWRAFVHEFGLVAAKKRMKDCRTVEEARRYMARLSASYDAELRAEEWGL